LPPVFADAFADANVENFLDNFSDPQCEHFAPCQLPERTRSSLSFSHPSQ
jgi:hypothetical protein